MKCPLIYVLAIILSFSISGSAQIFLDDAPNQGIDRGCGTCDVGSGLSFVDFNQDGWDDLTLGTQEGDSLMFYLNIAGSFQQIDPLISDTGYTKQVLWVDFDKDGDKDLFVANFGLPNRLYENTGNLNLVDITAQAGLPIDSLTSTAAAFGDVDNDGWLDLYISQWDYLDIALNKLYKNNGDGTFTDITVSSGVDIGFTPTLAVAFLDYNNDGWTDLYISEDRYDFANKLFENDGDGTFTNVSVASGTDISIDAMNAGCGDYDNDGDLDIYVTNTPLGNKMLRNESDGTFTEVASELGVEYLEVGWGSRFFDYDNDRDMDLYMCGMHEGAQNRSILYINRTAYTGTFYEYVIPGDTLNNFACAVADYNQDGKLDIAVNSSTPIGNAENDYRLWKNNAPPRFNWIKVQLMGVESNVEGVGSWIEMYLGADKYVRYTHMGAEYLGQSSNTTQLGTGFAVNVDSLIVKWPSGTVDKLYDLEVNQKYNITEGQTMPHEFYAFTNANAETGIDVDHDGELATWDIMGVGSGACWIDFNNDNRLDLYVTMRTTESNKLYFQHTNGYFYDRANALGVTNLEGDGGGVSAADFNNDGYVDLYLANCNEDKLYLNHNGYKFLDVTESMGFDITDDSRGTSASWGDYDNDGFLDLFVTHHMELPGSTNAALTDKLYHNDGGTGFTDVTAQITAAGDNNGASFIGGWTDFDKDGDMDIIIINDCLNTIPVHTKVFRNDGGSDPFNWNWSEVSVSVGIDDCRNGMGIAMGDYNRDGWTDIAYTNVGPAVLFKNNNGIFSDESMVAGIDGQVWPLYSWGTSFVDFDLNGWQDLYIVLGSLHYPSPEDPHPDFFYRNNENGINFTDISTQVNMSDTTRARNAAMGDYDRDGDPDFFLLNYGEQCVVKKNNNEQTGRHYLNIDLVGTVSNRDGIGAKIKITTPDNVDQYWEMRSGSNLGAGDALEAYFGLNDQTMVSTIEVTWPSGIIQTLTNVPADQLLQITEPNGIGNQDPSEKLVAQHKEGIEESVGFRSASNDIKLYPNPVSSTQVYLEIEGYQGHSEIKVIDLSGKVLIRQALIKDQASTRINSLDIQEFKPGLYIVQVAHESGMVRNVKLFVNP